LHYHSDIVFFYPIDYSECLSNIQQKGRFMTRSLCMTIYILSISSLSAIETRSLDGQEFQLSSDYSPKPFIIECPVQSKSANLTKDYPQVKKRACRGLACAMEKVADTIEGAGALDERPIKQFGIAPKTITQGGKQIHRYKVPYTAQYRYRMKFDFSIALSPGDDIYSFYPDVSKKARQFRIDYSPGEVQAFIGESAIKAHQESMSLIDRKQLAGADSQLEQFVSQEVRFNEDELRQIRSAREGVIEREVPLSVCGSRKAVLFQVRWKAVDKEVESHEFY